VCGAGPVIEVDSVVEVVLVINAGGVGASFEIDDFAAGTGDPLSVGKLSILGAMRKSKHLLARMCLSTPP